MPSGLFPRLSALPLLSLPLAGCMADLKGDWEGEIDCGDAGTVAMDLSVKGQPGTYRAEGEVSDLVVNGVESEIDMELDITQKDRRGPQVLRVEASCELDQGDAASDFDCSGFQKIGWDGDNKMGASIEGFTGPDYDCKLKLQRVTGF